jgi:hypothetical protein
MSCNLEALGMQQLCMLNEMMLQNKQLADTMNSVSL